MRSYLHDVFLIGIDVVEAQVYFVDEVVNGRVRVGFDALLHPGQVQHVDLALHRLLIKGTLREHRGNIEGTLREHSGNIEGTLREH